VLAHSPKPILLSDYSLRRDMKVKRKGSHAVLTGHAVSRLAVAVHNFLSEEAETLHGVAGSLAARYSVFTKANHADFGAQGFSVLNRPAEVCGFECEHFSWLRSWDCRRVRLREF
jgi:hypothetical protein